MLSSKSAISGVAAALRHICVIWLWPLPSLLQDTFDLKEKQNLFIAATNVEAAGRKQFIILTAILSCRFHILLECWNIADHEILKRLGLWEEAEELLHNRAREINWEKRNMRHLRRARELINGREQMWLIFTTKLIYYFHSLSLIFRLSPPHSYLVLQSLHQSSDQSIFTLH